VHRAAPHRQGGHTVQRRWIAAAATTLALASALAPARASAGRSDQATTSAYLQANYRLVAAAASRIPTIESTLRGILQRMRSECPNAAAGSPQTPQSTQLSNEVIGAMVTAVVALDRPAGHAFVAATQHLRWSDRRLTREVHAYVAKVRTLSGLAQPHLCADVRAWAATGFHALSPATISFSPLFMSVWVAAGERPPALSASETSAERALIARTARLEMKLTELEAREVHTWGAIMDVLDLWP
jgi:hypothetical protein